MKDKSKRIPVKYHTLINAFLQYCFYSKENKDDASEEIGDSTETLEKFNGLHILCYFSFMNIWFTHSIITLRNQKQ